MAAGKKKAPDPLTIALRFLSFRERTEHEMREKLLSKELYSTQEIASTINYLLESNYLNDQRFATELAGSRVRNKLWGRHKISLDLKKRKIANEVIDSIITSIDDEAELKTATAALTKWLRKSGAKTPLSNKEFERAFRHLNSRGFGTATALGVLAPLRSTETDDFN